MDPHVEQAVSTSLSLIIEERVALLGWQIDNAEDQETAAAMLRDVKRRYRMLEEKRRTVTKPLLAAKKAVDDLFRSPLEILSEVEGILKEKIAAHLDAADAANTAALVAVAEAESLEDATATLATVVHVEAPRGVSVRHAWRPVVYDDALLDRAFLSPDMSKINAHAREHFDASGKPDAISGVRFEREAIVTSREVST